MQETASALGLIVDRLERKAKERSKTDQLLVKARQMQTSEKAICLLPSTDCRYIFERCQDEQKWFFQKFCV